MFTRTMAFSTVKYCVNRFRQSDILPWMIENMDFINLFMSTVLIVVLGFQASYTQIAHYGKLKVSSLIVLFNYSDSNRNRYIKWKFYW